MNQASNRLWIVAFPLSVALLAAALYNGQVGVEYHGGGAWLEFDRTDFVERARIAWH